MNKILGLIKSKKQAFAELPFFLHITDKTIHPATRLAFAPAFSFFVMGFAELNEQVLRTETSTDPIQLLINQHTREDDKHWMFFIHDLEMLGINFEMKFADALKYLFHKDNLPSRRIIYSLHAIASRLANPTQKLIMIEAIEATADIFLKSTDVLIQDLKKSTQMNYMYFGGTHLTLDSSHSIHDGQIQDIMESIELTEAQEQDAIAIVEQVFTMFEKFFSELLDYAQKYPDFQEFPNFPSTQFNPLMELSGVSA
ncbi:MAG: hypothetical protein F6K22_20120 [Okeania sp. SIO2F4]|uniref:hypothetical protein n=1 Tax=Okeania sp. SIO2F4 TaxID=2607790 RepID=UPI00142A879B|nr:hypothetical protein [Okeania sp. SIO2F4]NES04934.1 hypothetical protein [Okeania sp. SIO2F4]